ncbi:MAG: SH3 domain-containing protein [Allomuricauda sp.]
MKSKCTIAVFAALMTFALTFAQRIHDIDAFQPGEQVYAFGNNVKLRAAPDTDSKVLELLKMGEWVKIIEKTHFSWPYKGIDHSFYKVKYNDIIGYVLGGLLSLERKTVNGTHYYFAYGQKGDETYLNIRSRYMGQLHEKKVPLSHKNFSVDTYGNRGIPNLDGILYVQYHFGREYHEGGIYLFALKGVLTDYELSRSYDSDRAYRLERFIFPDDEGGIAGRITFRKEMGKHYKRGSENIWLHTGLETWKLTWENGELTPNFRDSNPD